jgi:Protein of unknown function (DUF2845)
VRRAPATVACILLLAVAALAASPAQAMRCGQRLIAKGDSSAKVLRFCGEPQSVEVRISRGLYSGPEAAYWPGLFTDVRVEEWTYNFGPRKLMRLIRLENGVVADIQELGYGFRE